MSIQFNLPDKILFAHRGCSGNYPENTLLAFIKALESPANAIELDVMLTKDLEFIISHEQVLWVENKPYNLKNMTLSEIIKMQLPESFKGERIPTLEDVLKIIPQDFILNIELKLNYSENYNTYVKKIIPILTPYLGKIKFLLSSFHPLTIRALQKWKKIPTAFIIEDTPLSRLAEFLIKIFRWNADYITLDIAMNEHNNWLNKTQFNGVSLYTINDAEQTELLFLAGISGIFTDYPEHMKKLIKTNNR